MNRDVYLYGYWAIRCTSRALIVSLISCVAVAAPNVLNLGSHADTLVAPAINAVLGPGVVDASIYVDYDPNGLLQNFTQPSSSTRSVASNALVNHFPYGVGNLPFCCSLGESDDGQYYQLLYASNAILSLPTAFNVGGVLPAGTAPPTYNTATSSTNSTNGGTGWGIEFGLSASYLGLDTTEDSWDSAAMAGFLAALGYQHPAWNWFDIKAALRQTASQWATGYSHAAYGYGFIDWRAANAIASPGALYLQPPGVVVKTTDTTAQITLYPFRQTRRNHEVIYSINPSYVWPAGKNELLSSDLAAAGATLLYSSNGTDLIPTTSIARPITAPLTIVAFTTDGAGHFSRVEEFSRHLIDNLGVGTPVPLWAQFLLAGLLLAGTLVGRSRSA
jgi:hypothetical protein